MTSTVKNIHATLGMMFLGLALATTLWGVCCIQCWYYLDRYRKDKKWLKAFVLLAFLSDAAHQIVIIYTVYRYAVTHFGDVSYLNRVHWGLNLQVALNSLTAIIVQSFFIRRLWVAKQSRLMMAFFVTMALAELASAISTISTATILHHYINPRGSYHAAYLVLAQHRTSFAALTQLGTRKALSMTNNCITILLNLCMFICNCMIGEAFTQDHTHRGDHRFNRWFFFALDSGLFIVICTSLSLITVSVKPGPPDSPLLQELISRRQTLILPNSFVYICFYFMLGRIYVTSLLSTLNTRTNTHRVYEFPGTSSLPRSSNRSRPQAQVSHPTASVESIQIYFDRVKQTVTSEVDVQRSRKTKKLTANQSGGTKDSHDEPFASASISVQARQGVCV
ncbi:hypothetical protein V5O48_010428 [Marasmius crinis-equi]|uniref:DUF6534 domain-containing protein n=1 Tax=Marasmius crinis-equi TaxID=585013 RepID=A0ABR3F8D1_9AGAR